VSVLAITGLVLARVFGWVFMDPVMGIVGAIVISNWSWSLVRQTGSVLLDARASEGLASEIAERLETDGDRISDLHLWRVGPGHNAAIVSLVTHAPRSPAFYKARLAGLPLSHLTVEVATCEDAHA